MESEQGVAPTRRQVIRRGALVAGALVWTAPAVQSLAPAALAQGSLGCVGCLTGGGQILGGFCDGAAADKISFGLGPICCPTNDPTEIEVNCHPAGRPASKSVSYHFDIDDVVTCSRVADPSPGPNTRPCANRYQGTVKDQYGNTLTFDFSDNGEPGKNDKATVTVTSSDGVTILVHGSGDLDHGNLQVHPFLGPMKVECDCTVAPTT